jgi:hypothetical protein
MAHERKEAAILVAKWLGFRLIDEDIVTRAAVEAGVDQQVVAEPRSVSMRGRPREPQAIRCRAR